MKSLYFRNFIISASMVLFSFLILGVAFVILTRSHIVSDKNENLSRTAEETAKLVQARFAADASEDDGTLQMTLSALAYATGNHIFICDYTGIVQYCSDDYYCVEHIGRQVNSQVMDILRTEEHVNLRTELSGFYNRTHYVSAEGIYLSGYPEPMFYAFVSTDSSTLMDTWETFLTLFFGAAAVILLLSVLLSLVTSKQQARPINIIAETARSFAHGDFSMRVNETMRMPRELEELSSAFNAMAQSIEESDQRRSEFIANVSHELKTPMTTISGFADGLLDGTIPQENQQRYLQTISMETKRLSRLVRRMLELSRIQSSDTETLLRREFDISETMRRTLINFESKITERGLDVDAALPENSIIVCGDPDAITQVVYNLLENAIKFANTNSTIGVSLWKEGSKAYVSVKNEGEPLSQEEIALIFERFHKTDKSRSLDRDGVGLGLYIVKSILTNHGEDITVSSKHGITEFVFTLTLKPQKSGRENGKNKAKSEPEYLDVPARKE